MKRARNWLQDVLGRMFQPISKLDALRIAATVLEDNVREVPLICHETKPDNYRIYSAPSEPCWYISVPWNHNQNVAAISSSRVILIGKLTGTIHYDGSAGDEG
jgi:hypothetical protein